MREISHRNLVGLWLLLGYSLCASAFATSRLRRISLSERRAERRTWTKCLMWVCCFFQMSFLKIAMLYLTNIRIHIFTISHCHRAPMYLLTSFHTFFPESCDEKRCTVYHFTKVDHFDSAIRLLFSDAYLILSLFQTPFKQAAELSATRAHLTSCFESFSCYLLPHPGFRVAERKSYKGEAKGSASLFETFDLSQKLWANRT